MTKFGAAAAAALLMLPAAASAATFSGRVYAGLTNTVDGADAIIGSGAPVISFTASTLQALTGNVFTNVKDLLDGIYASDPGYSISTTTAGANQSYQNSIFVFSGFADLEGVDRTFAVSVTTAFA